MCWTYSKRKLKPACCMKGSSWDDCTVARIRTANFSGNETFRISTRSRDNPTDPGKTVVGCHPSINPFEMQRCRGAREGSRNRRRADEKLVNIDVCRFVPIAQSTSAWSTSFLCPRRRFVENRSVCVSFWNSPDTKPRERWRETNGKKRESARRHGGRR